MKSSEIHGKKCISCDESIYDQRKGLLFYHLKVDAYAPDKAAAKRTGGLAMMLGDSVQLAEIFSPDPDIFKIASQSDFWICNACIQKSVFEPALWLSHIMTFNPTKWAQGIIGNTLKKGKSKHDAE